MNIKEQLKSIPDKSGVYIFKDKEERVLYVGKAKNLKRRVSSYFQNKNLLPWTRVMVKLVEKVETVVTQNEFEALLLENNLIKSYQTPFNIKMRDDKTYPYIKITNEVFPRLLMTRKVEADGSQYFGPYLSVYAMRETIELLRRLFGIVTHSYKVGQRPCLNYQTGLCSAPYAGKISGEDYAKNVEKSIKLIKGEYKSVEREIEKSMNEAAKTEEYEKAAHLRNQLSSLRRIIEHQRVASTGLENRDIIAVATHYSLACGEIMLMRNGQILHDYHFLLENIEGKSEEEIIQSVANQYYLTSEDVPKEILLSVQLADEGILNEALKYKGWKTHFYVPKSGTKKRLIELCRSNAEHHLSVAAQKTNVNKKVLIELQKALSLPEIPRRIEAFDISNLGETEAVGAMVTFVDGEPYKDHYRKFIIKTVDGQNDTAMMAEIVKRRLANKNLPKPSLILIDGGKGQLSSVIKVFEDLGVNLPIIGLAKKWELIYSPNRIEPIILANDSHALLLLQKIRDEVHRFGISFHRKRRAKKFLNK